MTPEEHNRIVEAGLKKLGVKQHELADFERLLAEAEARIRNVRQYATLICTEMRDAGKQLNRKMLMEDLSAKFLDNFCHYNKDELLLMLCFHLTNHTIKDLV